MSEQFPLHESQENNRITKEEIIKALALNGKEHAPTIALLSKWIEQNQEKIRSIADLREQNHATISFEIEKAGLYFETGFWQIALEELEGEDGENGIKDAALLSNERELYIESLDLIERIKSHIVSTENILAEAVVTVPDLETLSIAQLNKKLTEVLSSDDENYELAAQIKEELDKRLKD